MPQLRNRTLELSLDAPTAYYQYEVCTKSLLWFCIETEMKRDLYDLTDPEERKRLHAMDFVLRVRGRK